MDLTKVQSKLEGGVYLSLSQVIDDVLLVGSLTQLSGSAAEISHPWKNKALASAGLDELLFIQ